MSQPPVDSALGQPTTTPNPVRIQTIGQRDPETIDNKVLPSPSFGHRASWNGCGGVHEDHHKEKEHHHPSVVHSAVQEPTRRANDAIRERSGSFPRRINCCSQSPTAVKYRQTRT